MDSENELQTGLIYSLFIVLWAVLKDKFSLSFTSFLKKYDQNRKIGNVVDFGMHILRVFSMEQPPE
jgi:hypothetical protein